MHLQRPYYSTLFFLLISLFFVIFHDFLISFRQFSLKKKMTNLVIRFSLKWEADVLDAVNVSKLKRVVWFILRRSSKWKVQEKVRKKYSDSARNADMKCLIMWFSLIKDDCKLLVLIHFMYGHEDSLILQKKKISKCFPSNFLIPQLKNAVNT